MPTLNIHILGGFQILLDDTPVQGFDSDKVRLLLAYLAVENSHPQRRESLAALLWPESPPSDGRANLRWALSNLRKVIGDRAASPPFLCITRQTIHLNPAASIWIDISEFTARLKASQENIQHLEEAIQLYQGEFLAGLTPKAGLQLDEWLLLKRENLARILVNALKTITDLYIQRGEYHQALPHARRRVELEPWQEQGHRQLIRLLAYTGQRNAALAQYQSCKEMLVQTLGVQPERETTALYERIRQGSTTPKTTLQHNLPTPLTTLIGREKERQQIQSWLKQPKYRLITITGIGGIGKTHLAVASAHAQKGNFQHGIYLVHLNMLTTSLGMVPAIAEAIGFNFAHHKDLRAQLLDYLRDKEMLLVLDNFEHLLEGSDLVVEILGIAPAVKIIATSRVNLNLPGEQRQPLSGLALPSDHQSALQSDAVKLFIEAAQRIRPQATLTPEELAAIVQICRFVEGLPLGILLAVSWVDVLTPIEIAGQIQDSLNLLDTDWQQLSDQHRSIRAVMQHSWDLLDEQGRLKLAALAVFHGSFTRQAAQEITGISPASLQQLINQSLLNWSATGRFQLHELLRQFATEQLARSPEHQFNTQNRHSDYFLTRLMQWGEQLKGPQQSTALTELRTEQNNLTSAWKWALQQESAAQFLPALEGLCRYFEWRVRYKEGISICQATLAQLRQSRQITPKQRRLKMRSLLWQSRFCWLLSKKVEAFQLLEQVLKEIDDLEQNDPHYFYERGFVSQIQGGLVESSNRIEAMHYYGKSLQYFIQAGAHWEIGELLSALGSVSWNLGDYVTAADYHHQALEARQQLGDTRGIARSSMALGTTLLYQGRFNDAEPLVSQGSLLRKQVGDRLGIADSLRFLGFTRMVMGRFTDAVDLLFEAVQIYESLGLRYGLEMAMLAAAYAHQGDFEQAWYWSNQSLEAANETGYRRALGYAWLTHGELALSQADHTLAEDALQKSLSFYRQIYQREELSRVLIISLFLATERQLVSQAEYLLQEAEQLIWECQAFIHLLYLVPAKARLVAQNGDHQNAAQMLAAVSYYPLVRHSKWFAQLLGDQLIDFPRDKTKNASEQTAREALWQFISVER